MSTTEEQNPSPLTKSWHEAFGGRHTVTAFKSHVIPLLLSILVWHLFDAHSFAAFACQFRDDARLLLLWPFNAIYFDQLAGSDYSPNQICWLYAVTSTTSAIWLCWLVWRLGFEIFRPNVIYVTNGTKILWEESLEHRRCGYSQLYFVCGFLHKDFMPIIGSTD
jgi:hypothetical protein